MLAPKAIATWNHSLGPPTLRLTEPAELRIDFWLDGLHFEPTADASGLHEFDANRQKQLSTSEIQRYGPGSDGALN